MKNLWPTVVKSALLFTVLILAGCSTPASRISKNQDFYNTLPPAHQEQIADGKIEPGYNKQMVYLALGSPHRKYRRTTGEGQRTVWSYVRVERRDTHDWMSVPVRVRGSDGRMYRSRERVRVEVEHEREIERTRVEFDNDQVTAIEELFQ